MKKKLVLENGMVLHGEGFGFNTESFGEVVFQTGMTGYQEVLTDPSYYGQMVVMTYPLIGNYGLNREDMESFKPHIQALIVKESCDRPSHWQEKWSIDEFLKMHQIPGLKGIDTRMLTKIIREHGSLRGAIVNEEQDEKEVVTSLLERSWPTDQVAQVSTKTPYPSPGRGKRVVVVDFGMKHGILRELNQRDANVLVVPHTITSEELLTLAPDGVVLSNGPGNPEDVGHAVEMIKGILGKLPIFGICLGHQLLSLACGAKTYKLKFGHRGANHPVKDIKHDKVYITSQNHGYAVDKDSLEGTDLEMTHVAINDGTVEGVRHRKYPAFSVQYHPEASPGPDDSSYLFDEWMETLEKSLV
ncbi:carbamoyl phosphate synthase small subunit [Bacillus carboniphilus]|uniref:Carbamoyl phosphate synthase small chain n=1 Tax=Bacillus carboniphilus TaxID=86663 RepID=A0ABP3G202_9BACI